MGRNPGKKNLESPPCFKKYLMARREIKVYYCPIRKKGIKGPVNLA
jgi:hypothetical protein